MKQYLAINPSDVAPMRLHHTVHLLRHGHHFGWLALGFTILIFGLLIAAAIYRRGQGGSGQPPSTYRSTAMAPWQPSSFNQPPPAPWQSGMASSVEPHYGQPAYSSTPWTPPSSPPAWNTSQANYWPARL